MAIDMSSIPVLLLIGSIAVPAFVYAYLGTGEAILGRLGFRWVDIARPLVWLLLPLALVAIILVYPLIDTILTAFRSADGNKWVGLKNIAWLFSDEMRSILVNNVLWIVLFPLGTVVLSLITALAFDKVKYERFAMTLVVLPTAISFTASSVIWRQFYSYQPPNRVQEGIFNALWTLIPGNKPIGWLQTHYLNTACLILVAIWASLGVAALILSAAVKNVPNDYIEAARIDGAGEWRILRSIILPEIAPAMLVVFTTEVIFSLKIFDIIYVMTNGNFDTNTLANRMYFELFAAGDLGHASAIAVLLLVVSVPIVALNVTQFRRDSR